MVTIASSCALRTIQLDQTSSYSGIRLSGKATLDAPPLSIRGTPVGNRRSKVEITNNNSAMPFVSPYPPFFGPYPQYYPPQPPLPYSPQLSMHPTSTTCPHPGNLTPIRPSNSMLTSSPIDFSAPKAKNVAAYVD